LCGHFAAKGIGVDVVDKGPLAVDLQHREPLAVARLQPGVAIDLDLFELERDLLPNLRDYPPCPLAEMTTLSVVENDLRFAEVPRSD
jgi:hypothetical protein